MFIYVLLTPVNLFKDRSSFFGSLIYAHVTMIRDTVPSSDIRFDTMAGAGFILLINIAIGILFAFSFIGFSKRSNFRLGYWSAAGFVAAACTTLAESFAGILPARLVSTLSYGCLLTALSFIFVGVWQHYQVVRVLASITAFWLASMVFHQYVLLEVPRDGLLHALGYQASFAVLSLAAAIAIATSSRRRPVDVALFAVFSLMTLQFLAKSGLAYAISTGNSTETYVYSQYAMYSQTAAAILSLSLGVCLLTLVVSEIYGSRLDRAFRDNLSGLLGRDAFLEAVCDGVHVGRSWKRGCLLLADLDRFKIINDTFGHAAGDEVIATFGEVIATELPTGSINGRIGGEEFASFLPDTDLSRACDLAELIAQRLRSAEFSFAPQTPVTVSVGITMFDKQEQFSAVLHRADVALYRAKRLGRDRHEIDLPEQPGVKA